MTTSLDLMNLAIAALKSGAGTAAGDRILTPGNWPTFSGQYPAALVRLIAEERTSLGRGTPAFTTVATLQIAARVSASIEDFVGDGLAAELDAWALKRQIEQLLINNPVINKVIQQVAFTRTGVSVNSAGETTFVEALLDIGFEFYEGPDAFYPIAGVELDEAQIALSNFPPTKIDITL